MPVMMRAILATLLICVLCLGAPAQNDPNSVAERVDLHYNRLRSLTERFEVVYSGLGTERAESGTLWLQRPGRMRWDYGQPRRKLFVSDGTTVWLYVDGEAQAREAPVKSIDDLRSPLRYLLGKTKLAGELKDLALVLSPSLPAGNVMLRGKPKGVERSVQQVDLEITPASQIVRIKIEEIGGAITEFRFSEIRENVAIPEHLFHFTPPPGVGVIRTSDLAQ